MTDRSVIVTLSAQELMSLERIVVDNDSGEALEFVRELKRKIEAQERSQIKRDFE